MSLAGYDAILADRWSLADVTESLTMDEGLDDIAVRATLSLPVTRDFPGIEPGQALVVLSTAGTTLFDGIVWEPESTFRSLKRLTVVAYDRTIYLGKSEDEYLFPAGQTATQRLRRYASDWGLATVDLVDTKTPLARAVYRAQPIYSMIGADLVETATKGGAMFRARMTGRRLELVRIGSNTPVPALVTGQNVAEASQRRTLEGAATRVKVLGEAAEDAPSAVLAVATGDTAKLGTLQKVVQESKVTTVGEARTVAQAHLAGVQETVTAVAYGVESVRAGDKVLWDGTPWIVTRVKHRLGPGPVETSLDLAAAEYVRRAFFAA